MKLSKKDASFYKYSYFISVGCIIGYWLIRLIEKFTIASSMNFENTSYLYREAIVITVACLIVIICEIITVRRTRDIQNNAFWVPFIIFIGYIIAIIFVKEKVTYYFLAYFVLCGMGAVYHNWRKLLMFIICSNTIVIILSVSGVNICGTSATLQESITSWFMALFGSVFFLIITHFATDKMNKSSRAEDSFETLLEKTQMAIVLVDELIRVTYISKALADILHIDKIEFVIGRSLFDLFPDEYKLLVSEIIQKNGSYEDTKELSIYDTKGYYQIISEKLTGNTKGLFIGLINVTQIMRSKLEADRAVKAKSSFLAKMSHEIRTPMNAISGMSELILRESKVPEITEYALGVQQASAYLLSIINDILDFSKIDSGNMDIIDAPYDLSVLLKDVINIIRMRLIERSILFITDIDSEIPSKLLGDVVRIRQIMINVLNNAVKYTRKGFISLNMSGKYSDENTFLLTIKVKDSGLGIKKEDVNKVFGEFIQLELDTNKGIEGTGLGLAITKYLCTAMGGEISFASEYEKGSTFTISIPQKIADAEKIAEVKDASSKNILILENRALYADSIDTSLKSLNVKHTIVNSYSSLSETISDCLINESPDETPQKSEWSHIFVSSFFYESTKNLLKKQKIDANIVLLVNIGDIGIGSVQTITIPVSTISIANILNNETSDLYNNDSTKQIVRFTAPEAKILIVDDLNTNIMVARGLMSPYQIQIDTAMSGKEAIEMVRLKKYDIIFMDHMMPEMDGIETAEEILKLPYAADTKIVALTANAIVGVEEMFKSSGFHELLIKPIEMVKLNTILENCLPKEKIKTDMYNISHAAEIVAKTVMLATSKNETNPMIAEKSLQKMIKAATDIMKSSINDKELIIEGVNTEKGIANSGGLLDYYIDILKAFYDEGNLYLYRIKDAYSGGDIKLLEVYFHAIKSAAANIGSDNISAEAKLLEIACKENNTGLMKIKIPDFLADLNIIVSNVEAFLKNRNISTNDTPYFAAEPNDLLKAQLETFIEAVNSMDIQVIDNCLSLFEKTSDNALIRKQTDVIKLHILQSEYEEAADAAKEILNIL
ncbi:hypothetical protein FACS1894190_02510 [Spirochaetia bacterium]|nr:hypothetical protein FACS1894190_02510 [Spirochaetia bacterium]